MSHRRPNGNLKGPWLLRSCATTIAIVLALSLGVCRDVAAKAPPHATTIVTTGVFATPI